MDRFTKLLKVICRGLIVQDVLDIKVKLKSKKKYFDEHQQSSKQQAKFGRLRFDFLITEYHAYVEFDGEQHFKPIQFFGCEDGF